MNKVYALGVALIVTFTSCSKDPNEPPAKMVNGFEVVEVDGCEYLEKDGGILDNRYYGITHKGDCKNEIHKIK